MSIFTRRVHVKELQITWIHMQLFRYGKSKVAYVCIRRNMNSVEMNSIDCKHRRDD